MQTGAMYQNPGPYKSHLMLEEEWRIFSFRDFGGHMLGLLISMTLRRCFKLLGLWYFLVTYQENEFNIITQVFVVVLVKV